MSNDAIEAEAQALLEAFRTPRRRPNPRICRRLLDAEHETVDTGQGAVAAWRLGDGPAALLVHGWEDDNSLWDPLVDALWMAGRALVALDLPGHGYSAARGAGLIEAMAALSAVARRLGPIDAIVAHSFGVPASVHALEEGALASVDRLVAIAPPIAQAERFRWMGDRYGIPPEVLARAQALQEAHVGRPLAWFDLARAAPAMTAQALLIHSADDEMCPVDGTLALADAWPGAQLLLTDGFGHREVARERGVIDQIVAFLA